MKPNKILLLLGVFSMCVVGCNQKSNETSSDSPSKSVISSSKQSETTSASSFEWTTSETSSANSSILQPGNPSYPHATINGFPTTILNVFLSYNNLTDYFVPEIANDQEWGYCMYANFPILKLWTLESTSGVSYEEQYYEIFVNANTSLTNQYYGTIGYCVVNQLKPKVAFKSVGGYFIIYVSAPEYETKDTLDGNYPYSVLVENFDLMNYGDIPTLPHLEIGESGWRYQNFFDPNKGVWKLFAGCDDSNSPDNTEATGPALEDLCKELLESNGWTIDDHLYDNEGYFATKDSFEIQFFSWENSFRTWVYKK